MQRQPRKAILLAAGRGTRLRPYTDTVPKPLLPVKNRPTLDWILESLTLAGIEEVCVVTHYLKEQIDAYLEVQPWPIRTETVEQQQLTPSDKEPGSSKSIKTAVPGTAHAVLAALSQDNREPLLISATDYLTDLSFYADLLSFHRQHDADITVSLKKVPEAELSKRSSVRFNNDNMITEVVEKPEPGKAPSHFSANLVYVVPKGFRHNLLETTPSVRGELELQDAINYRLNSGGTARGLLQPTPDEWSPEKHG